MVIRFSDLDVCQLFGYTINTHIRECAIKTDVDTFKIFVAWVRTMPQGIRLPSDI